MQIEQEESSSGMWYLISGLIVGACAGVLLAPKSGVETREDLSELGRRGKDRAQSLFSRISDVIPTRVKIGAAAGAVKGGAREAVSSARDGLKRFSGT
jgi:gas vesicle protein